MNDARAVGERDAATPASSCETDAAAVPLERSRILRYAEGGWERVPAQAYKPDAAHFHGVVRRVLAAPDAASFELRYFEIAPGGHSTHERHDHVHVVVCLRGRGEVVIGGATYDVDFGDLAYVAPGDAHQFRNPGGEPFGFLCVVDAERDRPTPATPRPDDHGAGRT